MERLELPYYYGQEAIQYAFYRIPKLLVTDERFQGISTDAKLLYGLLLDRMSLSLENGWVDEENRAYIYFPVEEIMERMHCKSEKAVKRGVGLIEKKRQGQGKPQRIYVKKFTALDSIEKLPEESMGQLLCPEFRFSKN